MTDLGFLADFMIPVIVGICLCVGYVIKKWVKDVDNKYIPTVCALLGVILSIWISGWNVSPAVILSGLFSGLASTGLHQLFKQYIEKKEGNDLNKQRHIKRDKHLPLLVLAGHLRGKIPHVILV